MLNGSSIPLPSAITRDLPGLNGGVTVTAVRGGGPGVVGAPLVSLSRTALTDGQGQFSFARLAAGRYELSVNLNQYLSSNYGQKRPGGPGTTIALADAQQMKVSVPMIRGGVITGQVLNDTGEPVSNVQVRGLRYSIAGGVKRLQSNGYAQSDDRGVYRMFGLQPGDYIVSATPNESDTVMAERMRADMLAIEQAIASGAVQPPAGPGLPSTVAIPVQTGPSNPQGQNAQPPGFLPTYYPSTPMPATASVVHLNGGDERSGVDLQLQLIQATNIQGSVSNAPAQTAAAVQIALINADPSATPDQNSQTQTRLGPDGRFTLRNIAPGKYIISAQTVVAPQRIPEMMNGVPTSAPPQPRLEDSQRLWARAEIIVQGEPTITTSLTLQPGRTISGMVVFDMAQPPDPSRTRMTIALNPAPNSSLSFGPPLQGTVGADGRFTISGVVPGKYVLRAPAGQSKSSIIGGEDVLDFPLEFTGERDITDAVLTATDKINELSGVLTDALGKPVTDYTIVAASSDERFWTPGSRRIVTSRTSTDGHYQFRNLPPGAYVLAAVTDIENGAQYDPEFLRSLNAAGVRVTLSEGVKQTQDLRVR